MNHARWPERNTGDVVAADGVVLHEIKNVSLPFAQEPLSPGEAEGKGRYRCFWSTDDPRADILDYSGRWKNGP